MAEEKSGRIVIVTGGSRGLGAGIVQSFLDSGDSVATCSRKKTEEVTQWEGDPATADRILFVAADLSNRDDSDAFVKAVFERWGRIDILVNNAGVAIDGVLGLFSDADTDTVIDLNLKGTIHITRLVSRHMLTQHHGRIINISSIIGLSGYRGLAVYGATKAALDGFTRALARELGSRGITVNSIAPGYLKTEMSHGLDEEQLNQIVRRTPAGRLGEPEDVARAAQFLAADESDYITGHVLVLDGGLTC